MSFLNLCKLGSSALTDIKTEKKSRHLNLHHHIYFIRKLWLHAIFTKYILGILPLAAQYTQETFEVVPKVGAIFQNAFTSLNPTMKIGKQLKHLFSI